MYEDRGGGTKMPLLDNTGAPIRRKKFEENQRSIESTMRRIRNSTPTS
jgi:hypothetical protein